MGKLFFNIPLNLTIMPYHLYLLLTALLHAAAPICLPAQSASDEMAIRAFTREYMAAYNRQDIPALITMYTADAITIAGNADTIRETEEEITNRYMDVFTRYDGALLMRHIDLNWSDAQQAWVARGTYEGYGATYVYDIPYHGVTAYANTMVEEDGRWKIARSVVTPLVRTLVYQEVEDFAEWNSVLRGFLHQTGVLTHEIGTLQNAPGIDMFRRFGYSVYVAPVGLHFAGHLAAGEVERQVDDCLVIRLPQLDAVSLHILLEQAVGDVGENAAQRADEFGQVVLHEGGPDLLHDGADLADGGGSA
jgi:ketosteroid isomerase-like protein